MTVHKALLSMITWISRTYARDKYRISLLGLILANAPLLKPEMGRRGWDTKNSNILFKYFMSKYQYPNILFKNNCLFIKESNSIKLLMNHPMVFCRICTAQLFTLEVHEINSPHSELDGQTKFAPRWYNQLGTAFYPEISLSKDKKLYLKLSWNFPG